MPTSNSKSTKSSNQSSQRVGLVGVGLLGMAIAERLATQGVEVVAYDARREQTEQVQTIGGVAVGSVAEVGRLARRIILCLPNSQIMADVCEQLAPELQAGDVVIDTTTGSPEAAERAAEVLDSLGVQFVDATVAGSSQQLRRGEVLIMLSGPEQACELAERLFDACAAKQIRLGPAGQAAKMKLVVNLAIGLHRAVLAEALCLAQALELDGDVTLDVLRNSPAHSAMMDTKGEKMLQGDFAPQARLAQHLKDVRLILAAAEQLDATVPLSRQHAEILNQLVEAGFGEEDNSAVYRYFAR